MQTTFAIPPLSRLSNPAARGSRGLSLIEILIVLAIMSLMMSGVAIVAFKLFERAKYKAAGNDVATWAQSVETHRLQEGGCPETAQDLVDAGLISRTSKDPWGGEYRIVCPGEHGNVDISSAGKDGEFGTEDDVNSWGELPSPE